MVGTSGDRTSFPDIAEIRGFPVVSQWFPYFKWFWQFGMLWGGRDVVYGYCKSEVHNIWGDMGRHHV